MFLSYNRNWFYYALYWDEKRLLYHKHRCNLLKYALANTILNNSSKLMWDYCVMLVVYKRHQRLPHAANEMLLHILLMCNCIIIMRYSYKICRSTDTITLWVTFSASTINTYIGWQFALKQRTVYSMTMSRPTTWNSDKHGNLATAWQFGVKPYM